MKNNYINGGGKLSRDIGKRETSFLCKKCESVSVLIIICGLLLIFRSQRASVSKLGKFCL